jgi:hypothetical protein
VKNRFYGRLRKTLRKLNRASKNLARKFKKELKYESITRIIDASEGLFRLMSPLREEGFGLSRRILSLAEESDEEMSCSRAEDMILEINKFNMATRSYKSKKKIKNRHSYSRKDREGRMPRGDIGGRKPKGEDPLCQEEELEGKWKGEEDFP